MSNNSDDIQDYRVAQMKQIQTKGLELFTIKNRDYGDSFSTYGIIGVLIRIQDKISRSITITQEGIYLVKDERIEDTLMDLHNYAAMALMLMEEGRCSAGNDDETTIIDIPNTCMNDNEI